MSDLARLAKLTSKLQWQLAGHRLKLYKPYPWQTEFHAAGKDHPERMLMAANRCITPWTVIETVPQARRIEELLFEKTFDVRAWADGSECVAQAYGLFLRGIEPAFRIYLDSGLWFDCSRRHRVLTSEGWLSLEELVRLSSGVRWTQTRKDYLASCGADGRPDGQQLHSGEDTAREQPPSQGGARKLDLVFGIEDVAGHISKYTHAYPGRDHHSSLDDPHQIAALCAEFVNPGSCTDALCRSETHQEVLRFLAESARALQDQEAQRRQPSLLLCGGEESGFCAADNTPEAEDDLGHGLPRSVSRYDLGQATLEWPDDGARITIFYPCSHPQLSRKSRIHSIVPLGYQPIIDVSVLGASNYFAAGEIHSNTGKTFSAAAEVSYHMTGDYPEWWVGRRFVKPVVVWTGSPTNETSRDILQVELLGGLGERLGTGAIPRGKIVGSPTTRQAGVKNVVDSFSIRHSSGGLSICTMKTYEQGWQKWQGSAPHLIWLDEEPEDRKIFTEAQTRILTSDGILMVTFTPLHGQTEIVDHFQKGTKGTFLIGATWDDAPHLDPVKRAELMARYPDYERDARTKGIPMMGEGAVFPIPDEEISFDIYRQWPDGVPRYFARIKGCDFGMDHPAAGVELAWDRDADTVYVIDCYKKAGETAPYHAAWLNKSNTWIPVSWPHDGVNREKSGGKTLADAYRQLHVNMLSKSARYPRVPGEEHDKGGGQPVEPIVEEMLQRMATGRLKVAQHLTQWFEEKRSYHRKDGQIVARRDDILKSTMYALMMKRYAVPESAANGAFHSSAPTSPIATTRIQ